MRLKGALQHYFHPQARSTRGAPHVRDAISFRRIAVVTVVALLPATFMAMWNTGLQANLAMARIGVDAVSGWRGAILGGLGDDAGDFLGNVAQGALYFVPVYLISILVARGWELLFAGVRGAR